MELLVLAQENAGDADLTYRDLVYSSVNGMLRSLDPHTNFLTPEIYDKMRERQQASFYGLGILVSMRDGQLTVISPIEGTPAWRLGMRAGDIISTIEGEATDKMTLDEAIGMLKGPKDTQVEIEIVRRGIDDPLPLSVTRAEIPQSTVRYAYMMDDTTGYVRLTDFSRSTAGEMEKALNKLRESGMERMILDLRSNGGGLLDQTVTVSNFFVPEKTRIVETRGRVADSREAYFSDGQHEPLDMPLVVLVNNGTASAAEILAGAIQDHDVGLVVGTPTWGKGLVQTVYNLSYGTAIALTTAKYYTPSGRLIQRDYTSYYDYYYSSLEDVDEPEVAATETDDVPEVSPENLEANTPEDPDQPEFVTDLGRKVYGGGGITPDVRVELPNGPSGLGYLYARNTFFNFAVDYAQANDIPNEDWEPPSDFLDGYRAWLVEEEIVKDDEDLDKIFADEQALNYMRRQIHADIFTSAFKSTEASHRILARGDEQILEAFELFDEAEDLLRTRHGLDGRRVDRVAAVKDETSSDG